MSSYEEIEASAAAEGVVLDRLTAEFMLKLSSATAIATSTSTSKRKRRVGFVGYGFLGKNLVSMVMSDPRAQEVMELAFVVDLGYPAGVMEDTDLPEAAKAASLENWQQYKADLIVEVAHPSVSTNWGEAFLEECDYMLASTTAFADKATEESLKAAASKPNGHGVYMAAGALFGSLDIQKMSDMGKLSSMRVIMKKHPLSLYPTEGSEQHRLNEQAKGSGSNGGEVTLFDGSVRDLAGIFPRNVNTICTAAIAAWSSVGMDNATACVITDNTLEKMIIDLTLEGAKNPETGKCLSINVCRDSPAAISGAVTSQATVASFLSSLLHVASNPPKGDGLHLC